MKRSAGVRLVVDSLCETIMLMMVVSEALFNLALPIIRRKKHLTIGHFGTLPFSVPNGAKWCKINATEL